MAIKVCTYFTFSSLPKHRLGTGIDRATVEQLQKKTEITARQYIKMQTTRLKERLNGRADRTRGRVGRLEGRMLQLEARVQQLDLQMQKLTEHMERTESRITKLTIVIPHNLTK
jgi:chromosome segregation ATPase